MMTNEERMKIKNDFNIFYEDIFTELSKYGEIVEMIVCGNLNQHMNGNVYIKFKDEKNAAETMK